MDIDAAISELTVSQKASLLSGSGFWFTEGIPELGIEPQMLTDGPHGLRKQVGDADHLGLNESVPATAFPTASASACSFDPDLLYRMGRAMGEECRKEGVSVILGPGVNMKRSPLCGRNFEYFSEDPLLAGSLGAALIAGVQSTGTGTSLKHFAANSQEKARMVTDSVIDARTLNEIYLRPFEIAVRASHPTTVMTAYNRLNGEYCSQNEHLLADTLRGRWGFTGACITDWGALSESVPSVAAGLDLCMPGPRTDHAAAIEAAVASGELSSGDLDRAVRNVLSIQHARERAETIDFTCDMDAHFDLARRIESESAVLLENNGVLPLDREAKVAVIGTFAMIPRYQGAGSSKINPARLDDAWSAFSDAGMDVVYAEGYDPEAWDPDEERIAEAAQLAAQCDAAVVFAGVPGHFESEGFDRNELLIPVGHRELIDRVCKANPATVVVLAGGSPMELPWMVGQSERPAAVLLGYLGGCASGHALVDCLVGAVNPSGKLVETWPKTLADTALADAFPSKEHEVCYIEGPFVGYRYYDAAHVEPAYPFGYGLSYTTFRYDGLSVDRDQSGMVVRCDISNTGERDGAEVVQVYVHACDQEVFMVDQALAGFAKVFIAAGETVHAVIPIDLHAFAHWDEAVGGWRAEAGAFEIRVGASSRDIRLTERVVLAAGEAFAEHPDAVDAGLPARVSERYAVSDEVRAALEPYYHVKPHGFTQEAFEALYARPLPQPRPVRPFTPDTVMRDIGESPVGRIVLRAVESTSKKILEKEGDDLKTIVDSMLDDMPLRSVLMGGVSYEMLMGIVNVLNGHYVRGFRTVAGKLLAAHRQERKKDAGAAQPAPDARSER